MKLQQKKLVQVEAKTLLIHMKVRDEFSCQIFDQDGNQIAEQDHDYVPDFMPGGWSKEPDGWHHGDYLILEIDMDTGQVKNWKASVLAVQAFIDRKSGDGSDQ